jgi:hypothetical protein
MGASTIGAVVAAPVGKKHGDMRFREFVDVSTVDVTAITAATTLTSDNDMVICDGTFTVTMPNIVTTGEEFIISNVGTGTITVDGNGSDTFYDETTIECIPNATLSLRSATTSTWVLV